MSRPTVVDDSALGPVVAHSINAECEQWPLRAEPVGAHHSCIAVHAAYGRGHRHLNSGLDIARSLRRDLRYPGRIIVFSALPIDRQGTSDSFVTCLLGAEAECWNLAFYVLPKDAEALAADIGSNSAALTESQVREFVLTHGGLEQYFASGWADLAHQIQGNSDSLVGLDVPMFRLLARNTEEYGPEWADRQNWSAGRPSGLSALASLTELRSMVEHEAPWDVQAALVDVDRIQRWLDPQVAAQAVTLSHYPAPPTAIETCSLVVIADDDEYDPRGLEALHYRVLAVCRTSDEAMQYLHDEQPHVFLCDLRWHDDPTVGKRLAAEAVTLGVPVVVLMSAGGFQIEVPEGVVPCVGADAKHDAQTIHRLIVRTWRDCLAHTRGAASAPGQDSDAC